MVEIVVTLSGPEYLRLSKEAREARLSVETYVARKVTEIKATWIPPKRDPHIDSWTGSV